MAYFDNNIYNFDNNMYNVENNINEYSNWDFKTIITFIIDKHKQIFLLILSFIIVIVVDYISYYNNLSYNLSPIIPGLASQNIPHISHITQNTFIKNKNKNKIFKKIKK